MKRLVLKVIRRLGRYAVLPVVALAGAMLVLWLMALDRYTVLALAVTPIVLPAAMATVALALGLILLPSRKARDPEVDEEAAPGLWTIWKELDPAFSRSGRTLRIDDDFNAWIREESRYAGLYGRHITMGVGLPLLIIMDERAIRAVVAHEVAHAQLQHTSGSANLYDFIAASENVLYYADPDRTVTGRVAHVLLHSFLEWLEAERLALSRENELCADADAARQVGPHEMARALVLIEAGKTRLADLVFIPLEKEVMGAIKAPTPPLQRILDRLEEIRAPEHMAAAAAVGHARALDPKLTHPPFRERLANLGFTEIPPIDEVRTSAIDKVLSRKTVRELITRFDAEWRRRVDAMVHIGSR
jgi:Zn-dependent protease with chaperone function